MDVLKMYIYANWIRDCICCFNVFYYTEPSRVNVDLLITHLELLYQTGTADISYWKDDKIDFEDLREMGNGIKRAVAEEDDSGLSDILNGRLKRQMDRITETLFQKDGAELRKQFWKTNYEALQERYPEIAEWMKEPGNEQETAGVRPYGLRGRVVFVAQKTEEYDLYASYSPTEIAVRMMEQFPIERYKKICVWGYEGGPEAEGIAMLKNESSEVELYITDLAVMKQVFMSTHRNGLLVRPDFNWIFEADIRRLTESISAQNGRDVFVYVNWHDRNGVEFLRKWIRNYPINSNIKERFG